MSPWSLELALVEIWTPWKSASATQQDCSPLQSPLIDIPSTSLPKLQVLSCTSGPRGAGGGEHSGHKQRWDSAGRERDIRGTGATHVPGETPYLVFLGKSVAESLPVYSPQRAWLRAGGCRTMISPLGRFWGYETI